MNKKMMALSAVAFLLVVVAPEAAFAGDGSGNLAGTTGGTATTGGLNDGGGLREIYTSWFGWLRGYLGAFLAMLAFGIGMAIGIPRQSPMAVLIGMVFAVALYYVPGIIDSMFGATIPMEAMLGVSAEAVAEVSSTTDVVVASTAG